MSKSVQVLINGKITFHDLSTFLGQVTNVRFVQNMEVEWLLTTAEAFLVDIRLYENDGTLEDDQGIDFSKYKYVLSLQAHSELDEVTNSEWAKQMAFFLAAVTSSRLNINCAVVDDLQNLLGVLPTVH